MKNIIFLLPLYNDWKSLQKLLSKINTQLKKISLKGSIVVIDDNSSFDPVVSIKKLKNIKKLDVLKLNKNLGSQKAISIGLSYLQLKKTKAIITILDSDGEDDYTRIPEMIFSAKKNKNKVVVSCRTRRTEGIFFNLLYALHKVIVFIFSGYWINFGNFSTFNSNNLKRILINKSSSLAVSAALAKNCQIIKLYAERKKRFYGNSKLSLFGLIDHALRVSLVFFPRFILVSFFYIFLIFFLKLNIFISYILVIFILFFNLCLLLSYIRNKSNLFDNNLKLICKKLHF